MHVKNYPYHFVCTCKKVLVKFGEKQDCEIFENKNLPKNFVKNLRRKNIYKMHTPEKTQYFEEKYPLKQ